MMELLYGQEGHGTWLQLNMVLKTGMEKELKKGLIIIFLVQPVVELGTS